MAKPKPPLGLARTLRGDVYRITDGRPMRWVMVDELRLRHADRTLAKIDAAVALAIGKGWMEGTGEPAHSVCLTDAGRRLAGQ